MIFSFIFAGWRRGVSRNSSRIEQSICEGASGVGIPTHHSVYKSKNTTRMNIYELEELLYGNKGNLSNEEELNLILKIYDSDNGSTFLSVEHYYIADIIR